MSIRVLMTGATGFIGSNFIKHVSMGGKKEILIDAIIRKRDITFIRGVKNIFYWDFNNRRGWIDAETQLAEHIGKYDVFLHCASLVGSVPNTTISDYYTVNVDATRRTLEMVRGFEIPHYVYISTGSVYGDCRGKFTERSSCNPVGAYATTKYIGELLCREFSGCVDSGDVLCPRTLSVLRIFYPYGDKMQKFRYIPSIFNKVKTETPIEIDYPYPLTINPIHVNDVSEYIRLSVLKKCVGIYNVAGKQSISEVEIANIFGEVIGKTPIYKFRKYGCNNWGLYEHNEYIGCNEVPINLEHQINIYDGLRYYAETNE